MIEKNSRLMKVSLYQNLGFLVILALCYLEDLLKLPLLIFSGHPFMVFYRRSMLEILLVLCVWFLVSGSTRRILDRIRYLEKFMRVCSWCRRIDYQGRWMPLEEFMQQGFDTPTTHGICKECLSREKEAYERSKKAIQTEPAAAQATG